MIASDPRRLPNCRLGFPSRLDVEQALERAKAGLGLFESLFPHDDRLRRAIAAAETWHNAADASPDDMAQKRTVAIGLAAQAATDAMLLKESAAVAEEAAWKAALAAALAGRAGNYST